MKRLFFLLLWVICIVLICMGIKKIFLLHPRFSLMEKQATYPVYKHQDDTLRILCIGDSWIEIGQTYEHYLSEELYKRIGKPVIVSFIGLQGQTSKDVYCSIFNNPYVYNKIKKGADFCFVSVGINDAIQKLGSNYYTHHTFLILDFLLSNEIRPILLEIPNIDILGTFERQKHKQWQNYFSMFVTNCPVDCLNEFRQKMDIRLKKEHLDKTVSILRSQMWNRQAELDLKHLYLPDGVHLNANGYYRLFYVLVDLVNDKIGHVPANKRDPIENCLIEKTNE